MSGESSATPAELGTAAPTNHPTDGMAQAVAEAAALGPLPPPVESVEQFPTLSLVYGLGFGLVAGVLLWVGAITQYFYLCYNFLVGMAVGWGVASGLRPANYARGWTMFGITAAMIFWAYFVYNVAFFCWWMLETKAPWTFSGFGTMLWLKLHNLSFFGQPPLSPYTTATIWLLEYLFSLYIAWTGVQQAMRLVRTRRVPAEVLEYVRTLRHEGYHADSIRPLLAARGWTDFAAQEQAIAAGQAAMDLQR